MIELNSVGSFKHTEKFLRSVSKLSLEQILDKYGRIGVDALWSATPQDSGITSTSWKYDVETTDDSFTITWSNSSMADTVPIAILIQYGHATGTGGYVQGVDFINPAMKPIFDSIVDNLWNEVKK